MDDGVVGIGLFLFALELLVLFCVAMLMVSLVFCVDYLLAITAIAVIAVPVAVLLWTIIEAVLSSHKMVMFCFMEVIGIVMSMPRAVFECCGT